MSDRSEAAHQKTFQRGQEAWRDNLERDNPYPPISPDHDFWRQGWEAEDEIQRK